MCKNGERLIRLDSTMGFSQVNTERKIQELDTMFNFVRKSNFHEIQSLIQTE